MRRDCPICRQPVRSAMRIYLNLDPSMSQRAVATEPSPPPPPPAPPTPQVAQSAVGVVDLASDSDEARIDTAPELSSDSQQSATSDPEYEDLENIRYSDIEPDFDMVEELQIALQVATRQLQDLRTEVRLLRDRLQSAENHVDVRQEVINEMGRQIALKSEELERERRAHDRAKQRYHAEESRANSLLKETEALRVEISALAMKKVAADIERILADLTVEQSVQFASDIARLPTPQVALRMAALTRSSKLDRAESLEAQKQLKIRSLESENLQRKLKKAEEELVALREENRLALENSATAPVEPLRVKPRVIHAGFLSENIPLAPPVSNSQVKPTINRPFSAIKAPPKFDLTKRGFEKPDGTGGSSKRPFF